MSFNHFPGVPQHHPEEQEQVAAGGTPDAATAQPPAAPLQGDQLIARPVIDRVVDLDPPPLELETNRDKLIIGSSGSGKSDVLRSMLDQAAARLRDGVDDRIIIDAGTRFDPAGKEIKEMGASVESDPAAADVLRKYLGTAARDAFRFADRYTSMEPEHMPQVPSGLLDKLITSTSYEPESPYEEPPLQEIHLADEPPLDSPRKSIYVDVDRSYPYISVDEANSLFDSTGEGLYYSRLQEQIWPETEDPVDIDRFDPGPMGGPGWDIDGEVLEVRDEPIDGHPAIGRNDEQQEDRRPEDER